MEGEFSCSAPIRARGVHQGNGSLPSEFQSDEGAMIEDIAGAVETRAVGEVAHRKLIAGQRHVGDPEQTITGSQGQAAGKLVRAGDT